MKTIKIMKRLMGCAAAILALTACSESEDLLAAYHSDSKAVHITAQEVKHLPMASPAAIRWVLLKSRQNSMKMMRLASRLMARMP